MRNALLPITVFKPPRQLTMALDTLELNGLSPSERNVTVARLARLLMEAAVEFEEDTDNGR